MNKPSISYIRRLRKFRYLWLKYVTGVNTKVHCARCLKGAYSKHIGNNSDLPPFLKLNEYEADYYYLCGVAQPYNWSDNFHLAFRYKKGSHIDIVRNNIAVRIEDAEELIIKEYDRENGLDPYKDVKAYYTCRNWQFAQMIKKEYEEVGEEGRRSQREQT